MATKSYYYTRQIYNMFFFLNQQNKVLRIATFVRVSSKASGLHSTV